MKPATTPSLITRFTRSLGLTLLVATTSLSHAQGVSDLPRSTVETISVSPAQRTQIQQFVDNWATRATSDSAQDTKRAVEALTEPLQGRGVSVAFRQAYTQSLSDLMNELVSDGSVAAKLSALRIAGDLATPSAVSRVRRMMDDDDHGVRLFAVSRAGQVFETTRVHGPAMTGSDATSLINAISRVGNNPNAHDELIRACARALASGAQLGTKDLGDARSQSIIALSDLVGDRLHALNPNEDPSFAQSLALDAASACTQSISDISADITPQAARAAVRLGGDIISVPLRRVVAKTIEPVAERSITGRSVQSGETLLYFARRKAAELKGEATNNILTTQFSNQLDSGNDRDFRDDAAALLGPGSSIVTEFEFEDDRFLR